MSLAGMKSVQEGFRDSEGSWLSTELILLLKYRGICRHGHDN